MNTRLQTTLPHSYLCQYGGLGMVVALLTPARVYDAGTW